MGDALPEPRPRQAAQRRRAGRRPDPLPHGRPDSPNGPRRARPVPIAVAAAIRRSDSRSEEHAMKPRHLVLFALLAATALTAPPALAQSVTGAPPQLPAILTQAEVGENACG